jgi:hypothetical protein
MRLSSCGCGGSSNGRPGQGSSCRRGADLSELCVREDNACLPRQLERAEPSERGVPVLDLVRRVAVLMAENVRDVRVVPNSRLFAVSKGGAHRRNAVTNAAAVKGSTKRCSEAQTAGRRALHLLSDDFHVR